ncbi:MAG: ribosome biogenesis GTPase Der [Candidatus Aminicenantes bacterium RBG_19FT_COMBO_65_30]|nr:MAG: ribosome biogenesis GTPase Der [Candidatus Aminicenantes bacterium RBG_19FT_COMBO_65_30]
MTKLPRVVIVGFPNVGKSTLFNRILGRRKSLVHSDPGMTRDSLAAECVLGDRRFTLVDTGGLFGIADEPLSDKVRDKALEEAAAADLVLFVLDGKRDIAPAEEELYFQLKRRGLPLLLVVNKFDSPVQEESMTAEYYRLGEKDVHFVSAEHKINVGLLEEAVAAALPVGETARDGAAPLRIAIVGRTNVGKSSLVNRLAGEERLIISEIPGTTRDSTDTLLVRDGKAFCLVDTAGIRKLAAAEDGREKAAIIRAKANIRQADVVCLILDVLEFPTRQDARIAQLALESGRPLVIALNKWDLVDKNAVRPDAVRERVFRKLGFVGYAPLLFVSARTGQRVIKILDTAEQVYKGASTRVETSKLNNFLARTAEAHPPRLKSGARAKLRYMTQKGVCPPTFILFLGARGPLAPTYEKYFLESLRQEFGFAGTPLRLIVRTS